MTTPSGHTEAGVRFAVAMQLLRIEPLMDEIRMMFAHRDYVTWLVASGGFRP
jgi:hypothetical protein